MSSRDVDSPWLCVTHVEEIPRRGARVVETRAGAIAIFRTSSGELFALEDRCPHLGGPLSQGLVHGRRVTCPLHDLEVCLATGRAVEGPGATACHAVREKDGKVYLAVSTWRPGGAEEPPCA